ncbi:hypothetical protein HanIR_Chr06g0259891 [Helianthus annuus]|nr:hypothetical protein HanIR_Chr06g0259891 [Helianthus annuus]
MHRDYLIHWFLRRRCIFIWFYTINLIFFKTCNLLLCCYVNQGIDVMSSNMFKHPTSCSKRSMTFSTAS